MVALVAIIVCWQSITDRHRPLSRLRELAPHALNIVICQEREYNTVFNCCLADVDDIVPIDTHGEAALHRTLRLAEERRKWRVQSADNNRQILASHRRRKGSLITDAQGYIRWINRGFSDITGYRLDEVAVVKTW